jgi:S1-C subfamily serine protease
VRQTSSADETGMLVMDYVVPGGPTNNHLEPRDILVCVNAEVVTQFLILETLLDDSVGIEIDLELERGGVLLKVTLQV